MALKKSSQSGPKSWPLLGHLPFLVFNILKAAGNFAEAVRRMLSDYGRRTLHLRVGGRPVVISADPGFARRVLVEHSSHFLKTGWEKRVLTPTMKDGLIILEGAEWKQHRAAVAPCFSAPLMEGLGNTIADAARHRVAGWKGTVAIGHEMRCVTNDVLSRFFLQDHRLADRGHGALDDYSRDFARVEEGLEDRVFDPLALVARLRAVARRQPAFSDALARITAVIEEQVSRAAAEPPPRKTALDLMLNHLPEESVCREIRTMVAAVATTAHLLTWLSYLLAKHPEVQRKLRREVNSSVDDHQLLSTLERCAYLQAVINEGLRLYPPAPYLLRRASPTLPADADPDLPAPRSLVLISVWAMHRHPDFWASPDDFVPERWLESREQGSDSVEAFIPFGMGPRVCIGRRFALIEAMIILSEIIRRFEIRVTKATSPTPKLTILTRPDKDISISVEPIRAARLYASPIIDDLSTDPSASAA